MNESPGQLQVRKTVSDVNRSSAITMTNRCLHAFVSFATFLTVTSLPLTTQIDDDGDHPWNPRADLRPDAEVPGLFYNMGVTDIRSDLVPDHPEALRVRHGFPETPAHRICRINDVVFGSNGMRFKDKHRDGYGMEIFGADDPATCVAIAGSPANPRPAILSPDGTPSQRQPSKPWWGGRGSAAGGGTQGSA